ncbi:hypothetical protein NDU88_001859, partial [Pleurodeles waltl]
GERAVPGRGRRAGEQTPKPGCRHGALAGERGGEKQRAARLHGTVILQHNNT